MKSTLTDYAQRIASRLKGHFFKVRLNRSMMLTVSDGTSQPCQAGAEIVLPERTVAEVRDSVTVLFQCSPSGERILSAVPEIELPTPPEMAPDPFKDGAECFHRWHKLSEQRRVLSERKHALDAFCRQIAMAAAGEPRDEGRLERAFNRGKMALDRVADEIDRFDEDAMHAARLACGRLVIAAFDTIRDEDADLMARALELFGLRVAALGLDPAGVGRLFHGSLLRMKASRPVRGGPDRRLGWDNGNQSDYSDDAPPTLWALLKSAETHRAETARIRKEIDADLAKARKVAEKVAA